MDILLSGKTEVVESGGKDYIYRVISVVLDKAEYEISYNVTGGSISVLRTRNGRTHATQYLPKTFWSWDEVATNYKLLRPHMDEVHRLVLELAS